MKKYEDFEIAIEKVTGGDGYAVGVRRACGQSGDATSEFKLAEVTGQEIVIDAEGGSVMRHITIQGGKPDQFTMVRPDSLPDNMAQEFGSRLSKAIFKDEIRELWGACKEKVKDKAALRIRLDLSRAPELAVLPWEYLRLPDGTNFAALDADTTIVRYLRMQDETRTLEVVPPLRVLVVYAMPQSVAQLAGDQEIIDIRQELTAMHGRVVEVTVLPQATIAGLEAALEKGKSTSRPFHVIHFLGHGAFDEEKQQGTLLFEDSAGNSAPVSDEDLGRLLQTYRADLRLLVLNACEGARLSPSDTYASVVARVMQIAEIPAAIAMQFRVRDRAAIEFAQAFYSNLPEGLERAVDIARLKIKALGSDRAEWATPVFYLRSKDGHLLDVKVPTVPVGLEGHYEAIKNVLPTCKLVFFLGLDVNGIDRPAYNPWKPELGAPTVSELSSYLALQLGFETRGHSFASLAQQLRLQSRNLNDEFRFFKRPKPPFKTDSRLYNVLGQLAKKVTDGLAPDGLDRLHKGLLFVTTTYDYSLENAFEQNGIERYHLFCYGLDDKGGCVFTHREYESGKIKKEVRLDSLNMPNEYLTWRDSAPVILKLPGEVSDDSDFAVTEDDFFAFATEPPSKLLPPDILTQVKDSRHLYLGYDVQNWTLRLLWSRMCAGQGIKEKRGSYAVVFDEKTDPNAPFWKEFEVNFAAASLDDYVFGLEHYVLQVL